MHNKSTKYSKTSNLKRKGQNKFKLFMNNAYVTIKDFLNKFLFYRKFNTSIIDGIISNWNKSCKFDNCL